jgi:uncharacterized membrane protein
MKKFFSRLGHYIWIIFLNGLFAILPFALTIALFTFLYRFINTWLEPIYRWEPSFIRAIPGSAIIVVILVVFLVGLLIRFLFLEPLIHAVERFFFSIPLMRPVYGGMKQLVRAFSVKDEFLFQRVVMIKFIQSQTYSIGFVSSELPDWVQNVQTSEKLYNVFVPTTPNPTSGFLVQVTESQMIPVNLTRQEAMSLIISGGIVKPNR